MPRHKPTSKIDVIGTLDLCPENAVGDFIESKQQEEYFVKAPNWDSAGDSIELMYIRNEREHGAMMRLQREMLENSKRMAATNLGRTMELYKYQNFLRKRFIEVNGFIKDCVDKKLVAERKVTEEKAFHKRLRTGIAHFKISITELQEFREHLRVTVAKFEPYERTIREVVAKSEIFTSIKDCTDRCDALMLAQVEISSLEQKKLREIEEMRRRMIKITNEAALTVLGLKNDLAELERSYNQARSECLRWEKILAKAKDCVANNDLCKDRALDAIHHMYRMLCKRRNLEPILHRHEIEKVLDFIKCEIEVLHDVVRECNISESEAESEFYSNTDNVHC